MFNLLIADLEEDMKKRVEELKKLKRVKAGGRQDIHVSVCR